MYGNVAVIFIAAYYCSVSEFHGALAGVLGSYPGLQSHMALLCRLYQAFAMRHLLKLGHRLCSELT